MVPAVEPQALVPLLELGTENGQGGALPQLQLHQPELHVRLVEQSLVNQSRPNVPYL